MAQAAGLRSYPETDCRFLLGFSSGGGIVEFRLRGWCEAAEHQMDIADLDHGPTGFGAALIVFAMTSTAAIPATSLTCRVARVAQFRERAVSRTIGA
jgi:hypothetical protein